MENLLSDNGNAAANGRRGFIIKTGIVTLAGISGVALAGLNSCKKEKEEEDITPPEDLMREHGVLNRVLLVYDRFLHLLSSKEAINPQWLTDAAGIIKSFIEDYHEKQEEDFLFPRFEKAGLLADLVKVLRTQHQQGRVVTEQLLALGKQPRIDTDADQQKLGSLLNSFIRMYRPHEAREDTVLFPAIRKIVSKHEFDSMGEDFEKREHQLFGEGGFETFTQKVATLEQQLGIYDLAQFTPGQPNT
jgi:hemerythrin-like domain-containing protein